MSKSVGNVIDPFALDRRLRRRSSFAISSCVRCRSARTATTARRRSSIASMPTSPTISATWRNARCRWSRVNSAAYCRKPAAFSDTDTAILALADGMLGKDARGDADAATAPGACHRVDGGCRGQPLFRQRSPLGACQERSAAPSDRALCHRGGDPTDRESWRSRSCRIRRQDCSICWPFPPGNGSSANSGQGTGSRPASPCRPPHQFFPAMWIAKEAHNPDADR